MFSILLLVALAFPPALRADPTPDPLVPVERSDDELMILELVFERQVLSDGLFAYVTSDGVLLPLRELLDAFELPIAVDPGTGVAEGWFLAEERRFHLDLARRQVMVEGRPAPFDPERVELHFDDIYVEAGLFGEWLPVDLAVDLPSLRVTARAREKLPLELRQERAVRWGKTGIGRSSATFREPLFPARPAPYRALGWPLLDVDLGLTLARAADGSTSVASRQSLLARGDLLGMTGELFLSGTARRLTLVRQDPEARLLGPLRASDVRLGDVGSLAEPLVGGSGEVRGLEISNVGARTKGRTGSSSVFDRVTLEGDVLPGWEAELYRNDVLEDFQAIGEDGRYRFADVALHVGLNLLRVVLHGPHGERRERIEKIHIGADLLPPGELRYRFGLYQQGMGFLAESAPGVLEHGAPHLALDVERGLTRSLSFGVGLSSLELDDGRHTYARVALKTSLAGVGARLRAVADARGGRAVQAGVQGRFGRVGVNLEHLENVGLESPELRGGTLGLLLSRTEARLDASFSLPRVGTLPLRLAGHRTLRRRTLRRRPDNANVGDGRLEELDLRAQTGLSLAFRGWRVRPQQSVEWRDERLHAPGEVRVEGDVGRVGMRAALSWDLVSADLLRSLSVTGHLDLLDDLRLSATLAQQLAIGGDTSLSVGADWPLDPLRLRLDAGTSSAGDLRVGASVAFGLGRDGAGRDGGTRRRRRWRMSEERRAARGEVLARIFLDRDGDGRRGPGDTPLPGVYLEVDGRRTETASDEHGRLRVPLPSHRHADVAIAVGTLEDPFWVPAVEGRGFVGRPGAQWTADFPVLLTGEVDGTVFFERDGERREAANVRLELVGADGEVAASCKSQFDGFYLFERVPPGRYELRVEPSQAERLGLAAATEEIELEGGEVVGGVEVVLG